ncbi:MAG: hypothetical protein ACXABX_08180 [Candidatus Thorarchaeota archaeon]|jgi:hypothetical protein
MSVIQERGSSEDRVVSRFTKYLNGPMGKTVLDNLEEGEDFLLHTSDRTFRVTKRDGRAVVELHQKQLD